MDLVWKFDENELVINEREQFLNQLLNQLTIEEKIGMVHGSALFHTAGVERLDIPPLVMSDGPCGVRFDFFDDKWVRLDYNHDHITYIPCNSAVAATFCPELAYACGRVLGEEGRGRGKDVMLAPGVNIKRTPFCGRNFEYFSEDPLLTAKLSAPMIQGIQEYDIACCVKHFAGNVQEQGRMHVDTIVDERTLFEIYFPAYIEAIKVGNAYSFMAAYNQINGEQCCTSKWLLDDVLRKTWGYNGVVISDWGGVHDTDEAVLCSLDVEMDIQYEFEEHYLANPLRKKLSEGLYDDKILDEKVRDILRLMYRLKMIGPDVNKRQKGAYNTIEHRNAVLDTAREAVVLLKNEEKAHSGKMLPVDGASYKKVAVIGDNAVRLHSNGGGSAEIKALYEICPFMGIAKELGGNARVSYAQGYFVDHEELATEENWQATSTNDDLVVEPHYKKRNISDALRRKQKKLREEAVLLAKESDLVIFVGGLNHHIDLEGGDKKELTLPYAQNELIEALLDVKPDTVIVLMGGSPVSMPWFDKAKAVVWSYYGGMEGGTAIADVLFGNVNPSGHLPETFLKDENQNLPIANGNFGNPDRIEFAEGVFVGYRQYDTDKTDVLFPFGFGLSYTDFLYDNLAISVDETDNLSLQVSFDVTNVGSVEGKTVAQIYVSDVEASVDRPLHELKAFEKLTLAPGETKQCEIILDAKAFSYYDEVQKCFILEPGEFRITIGEHSRDEKLSETIFISKEYMSLY